jgi:hypothetical protein
VASGNGLPVAFTWAGLTDTELRATPVPVAGTVGVTGTFWQATQPVSFAWSGLTDTELRATPVPVSGTVGVTGTFWQATQPVSAVSLPLPADAATETTLAAASAKLPASLGSKTAANSLSVAPASDAQFKTEPLGIPGVARTLSAGEANANTALTSTCRRASILALTADICFAVGSSSQTATASSHYIVAGERLDIALPETPNIGVIRAGSVNGTLRVTELL